MDPKLPFTPRKDSYCNIKSQSVLAKFLQNIKLAIYDEGPMLNKLCFEAFDRSIRDMVQDKRDKDSKFGGNNVLVSGDFRQLLPVMDRSNRGKVVRHTLKSSDTLWDDDVVILRLRKNMRVQNEINKYLNDEAMHQKLQQHEQWLLKLQEGRLPSADKFDSHDIVKIPSDMCHESNDDVVDEVFDDFECNIGDKSYFRSRILLVATNEIFDEANDELVERIPGDLRTFGRRFLPGARLFS